MTTAVGTDRAQPAVLTTQLFTAAWLSVALGFALEGLTALGAFSLGRGTHVQVFAANFGQKVSWGTLVCVGLAFAKVFKPKDVGASAWAGILAAPLAFTISRAAHKGLAGAMGLTVASVAPALFVLIATLKALEYGVLGAALARLDEREDATFATYLQTGTWVALLFGSAIIAASTVFGPAWPSAADWLARAVNELLFPIGCSLVLFAASAAGRRLNP